VPHAPAVWPDLRVQFIPGVIGFTNW